MPLIFKPGQRMTLTLPTDKGEPTPRKFYFAAPSGIEAMELADLNDSIRRDSAGGTLSGRDAIKRIFATLDKRCMGWDNCPAPHEPGKSVAEVVTLAESQHLLGALIAGGIGDDDKGN